MLLALDNRSTNSFVQFITVFLIFLLVIVICAFTTKFVAGYQKNKMMSGNIQVLETFKIANNKFIQIIKIGDKIFAVGIGKDSVTMLTELNEESLNFDESSDNSNLDFKNILDKSLNFKMKK